MWPFCPARQEGLRSNPFNFFCLLLVYTLLSNSLYILLVKSYP
ncbi:hypothetical protein DB41_EC00180 [Neochlamydia sp. TUME1]|nr:hypothetical protein DB41_EC00180 [Neochlamydia sp. TUME1]